MHTDACLQNGEHRELKEEAKPLAIAAEYGANERPIKKKSGLSSGIILAHHNTKETMIAAHQ